MHNPFTPAAAVPVDTRTARVHEEGWQSWSPSGSYALGAAPHRPTNDNWATVCYRPGRGVPAGAHQGEGLLALDPGDGSPVRLWAAPDPLHEVPSIRLTVAGGVAEVAADGPVKEWTGTGIQSVLAEWADSLALPAPRPAPTVWCSWYEYFTAVTEDDIHENLRAMDTLDLPIDVVQIDDGYQKALGDWLTLSGRFRSRQGIEDFTGDRSGPLYDPELSADRIRAARQVVDAAGEPFVLVGRTDVLLTGGPLAEAVRRADAYLAAGADCAFVPGAADAATIGTLVKEIDGPLNVVMGLTGGDLSLAELRELGVRRVTVGGSIARAMYAQLLGAARELAERGTFSYAEAQLPQDDLNELFRR
ncbi:isocitrate lyase/phosphoenolpyruvate mutase family protein [Streptomyces sp. NPDC007162]|uniref:isocitrate lyase/PEP mutase family protein n=1 Tax=Streptomyces sp. NPDC007162 TaxID=3156917 RepID=UPI0033D2D3F2